MNWQDVVIIAGAVVVVFIVGYVVFFRKRT